MYGIFKNTKCDNLSGIAQLMVVLESAVRTGTAGF